MQHTTKYKFNLIETSDTFSPDALNANAQAVEDALVTHEAAVDSALKSQKLAWQAADTALSQTVTANKSALEATVAANKSAADAALSQHTAQIAQCQADACFFKLAGPVTAATTNQAISISLSGIDMSQYRELILIVDGFDGGSSTTTLTVNGTYSAQILANSGNYAATELRFMSAGSRVNMSVGAGSILTSSSSSGSASSVSYPAVLAVAWTALQKLALSGWYPAGVTMTLYGIKR